MLECVVNVSEGRRLGVVDELASAAGRALLDLHSDPDHNRSVLTVVGTAAPRHIARVAVERLDLRQHDGVHPRIGVVDVVPFVALDPSCDAIEARDAFAAWAADELGVPCFLYGDERHGGARALPEVRRGAFGALAPDVGPSRPHATAGAIAVGARGVLVAYNVWIDDDLAHASAIARELRSDAVRALALPVGGRAQVSMNLVDPLRVGPATVYDAIASRADVARAELVGLVPRAVLDTVPAARWAELDLAEDRTIEARLGG